MKKTLCRRIRPILGWFILLGLSARPALASELPGPITAVLARGVTAEQKPFLPTDTFVPETARLFLVATSDLDGWAELVAEWLRPDGSVLGTDGLFLEKGERKALSLSAPPGGFEPGAYRVRLLVDGTEAVSSAFRIVEGPEIRKDEEVEPNDELKLASAIGSTLRIHGQTSEGEPDFFSFEPTGEPQRWLVEAEGRSISRLNYHDASGAPQLVCQTPTPAGWMAISNLYLTSGKNWFSVSGTGAAAVYEIRLTPLGPPDVHDEREPNNDATRAESLRESDYRQGSLSGLDDTDYYRFSTAVPESVSLRLVPPPGSSLDLAVRDELNGTVRDWGAEAPDREVGGSFSVPAGDYVVMVFSRSATSTKPYRLYFERKNAFLDPEHEIPELAGISLRPTTKPGVFAAYWDTGQSQQMTIGLESSSDAEQTLELEARANQPGVDAVLEPGKIVLAPGSKAKGSLTLTVPPDLSVSEPLVVSLRAKRPDGAQALGTFAVAADCDASPLNPKRTAPLPENLLGTMNVAWAALGASAVLEGVPEGEREKLGDRLSEIFDGMTPNDAGLALRDEDVARVGSPFAVTVQLAGDKPALVAGILLHPQCYLPASQHLKEFSLSLSLDGVSFTEALSGSLSGLRAEQAFGLPQPASARYARLVLRSNQSGKSVPIGLGEWKVLASAGPGSPGPGGLNIADLAKGGHVVSSDPLIPSEPSALVTPEIDGPSVPVEGQKVSWTLGFLHDRAARLERIEWVSGTSASTAGSSRPASHVSVETAVDSPIGPWEQLGDWALEPGPDRETVFKAAAPRWARYVRFVATLDSGVTQAELPRAIRVFEQPADSDYRSILGEWGHYSRQAIFESLVPPEPLPPVQEIGNTSRDKAFVLSSGKALGQEIKPASAEGGGQRAPAPAERWYRLAVPEGHNTLEISLVAYPQMPLAWTALDSAGKEMPLEVVLRTATSVSLRCRVEQGTEVVFGVSLAPHSVVLTWDNSISVSRLLPYIYRALERFASGVQKGRELVNLLPFSKAGKRFLLKEWSDDPFVLGAALGSYDRADDSSEAELALLDATQALDGRAGAKAIVLVTDAETGSYNETSNLWNELAKVGPRVFALDVHIVRKSRPLQQLMQSWAGAAGGRYDYFRTQRDLDLGFERAACLLRRPVRYSIMAETRLEAPKKPGTLCVVSDPEAPVRRGPSSAPRVELILDASGSMKRTLGKQTMMEAAKETLVKVVRELPAESQVALRAYGHRIREGQTGDCEDSELLQPLAKLDPAALTGRIMGLKALGTTPIDYSLRQVAGDLKGASGDSLVVLVTDGEEECGGDPVDAVRFLKEGGIRVQVNIVAFNLGAQAAKKPLAEAAASSGGAYFDAADTQGLERALQQAFAPPFSVLDQGEKTVATGTVGGKEVELPPGRYEVRIEGESASFPFEIGEGKSTVVRIARKNAGVEARVEAP